MSLAPAQPMTVNLAHLEKKRVTLHLRGGAVIAGIVGEVAEHFVRIEELEQKEFFDALVRVDDIVALETRTRTS